MLNQDLIRERAYMLWLESGGGIGGGDEHWLRAEREMTASQATPPSPVKARASKAPAGKKAAAVAAKPRATRRSTAAAPAA